jgi:hypothetical protein
MTHHNQTKKLTTWFLRIILIYRNMNDDDDFKDNLANVRSKIYWSLTYRDISATI